ncbi:MAG: hypothetical protein FJ291_17555 [Planctomycetes bacterium]|nr:hypothetical protein [Planctomycetota bacterium]
MRHVLAALLFGLALAGCGSGGLVRYGTYVGDRLVVPLGETVVAVPLAGAEGGYANLHITLAAAMNPRRAALGGQADAAAILHRTAPRISSAIIARAQQEKAVSVASLPALRAALLKEAESAFRAAIAKWVHAENYNIEFLATDFYLTNGSAAKSPPPPPPRPGSK